MTTDHSDLGRVKRRWYQFSVRSVLLLTFVLATMLSGWRVYIEPYGMQRKALKLIRAAGGRCTTVSGGSKWMRDVFGDENFQDIIHVDLGDGDITDGCLTYLVRFPRLETLVVGGPKFTDEGLLRLASLKTLQGLILDSTNTTDAGVEALRGSLPELKVYRTERRTIATIYRLGGDVYYYYQQTGAEAPRVPAWVRQLGIESHFAGVAEVRFHGPNVTSGDLALLDRFPRLFAVDLSNTSVDDAGLEHLKGLSVLNTLDLGYTKVSSEGLVHVEGLARLGELFLYHTAIGDAGLAHLEGLPNLHTVNLEGTQVTDAGAARLKRASRKHLTIYR